MSEEQGKYQTLPKNCPDQLREVIERLEGKYHPIAAELGVNVAHVHRYVTTGKKPRDKAIREQMFLAIKKPEVPHHIFWWRHLPKETRDGIIRQAWIQLCSPD